MYKDLFFKLMSIPYTRDALNCILRYTLAQPVEVDFMVTLLLIAEYTGLSALFTRMFDNQENEEVSENAVEDMLQPS